MMEKEYKILIPESNLHLLEFFSPWDDSFSQINFYYDVPEQTLHDSGIVIRVRSIFENIYLQVKVSKIRNNNIFVSEEYEKQIEKVPYVITSDEINDVCNMSLLVPDVYMHGFMQTHRSCKTIYANTTLFLDINTYLANTDYEIEIEYERKENLNIVLDQLRKLGIDTTASGISKSHRFFSSINNSSTD